MQCQIYARIIYNFWYHFKSQFSGAGVNLNYSCFLVIKKQISILDHNTENYWNNGKYEEIHEL